MDILKFVEDKRLIFALVIILISLIVYSVIKKLINIKIKNLDPHSNLNKKRTYLKLFNNIIKYFLIIIDIMFILNIYGINISSIVAGLGVVSVITGLALQDAFKDIIAGCNIFIDNYFSVGDIIKIDDIEGKILEIKLKVTKIKDIYTENIYVIANRNIVKALTISNQLDIDIPIPYEEKIEKVEKIIDEIIAEVKENKNVTKIEYLGINEYGDSAIYYKLRMWCHPELKPQVKRQTLRIIKIKLDKNDISIPYIQIDLHQK